MPPTHAAASTPEHASGKALRGPGQSASQLIVAALALPEIRPIAPEPARPLPTPDLHWLPRDGSMLYGIGPVDASGRVASRQIVEAMGWRSGDGIEVTVTPRAIVLRAAVGGSVSVPRRPCVVVPGSVRHRRGIKTGDHVLLVAAPDHGVVIVHTLSDLDDMLADYHASHSVVS